MCDWLQAMTWVNLITMCIFLGNAASGVVTAVLAVSGVYPKAEASGDEDSLDDAWVEGSAVSDEFHVSRPMKHWRHGYGFAFDVNRDEKKPFLVCFASGFAKRYAAAARPACRELVPDLRNMRSHGLCFCLPDCRSNANKLTRKFTIQTVPTHAWAVPSRDMLPQVCKGAHVFHCWLGSARVIEIHEVRGWLGQLTDRISRFHVRHIPATMEGRSSTCVRLGT